MNKKKKKNGFTLIELLAVIVILAIIALIATPIVMNMIKTARIKSARNTAYGVLKSAENYYAEKMLDTSGEGFPDVVFTCNGENCSYTDSETNEEVLLQFKGTAPTSGTISVKGNGEVKLASTLLINSYYCGYVDEQETAIDCRTSMNELDNSSEITPEELKEEVIRDLYPVGSIYITTADINPGEQFGGTWEKYSQGRTLMGEGTGTDSNGRNQTFGLGTTGGEYTHTLLTNEIPSHNHSNSVSFGTYSEGCSNCYSTDDIYIQAYAYDYGTRYYLNGIFKSGNHLGSTELNKTFTSSSVGSNGSHNIVQPYVTVYMWQRTE